VIDGDMVLSSDVNDPKECLQIMRDLLKGVFGEDPLIYELDAILARIPRVRVLDLVDPSHHNYLVDAMKKVRDIIAKKLDTSGLDAILAQIPYVKIGDVIDPLHHNLKVDALKKAGELVAILLIPPPPPPPYGGEILITTVAAQ
jgi:hypothetical protein